MADEPIDAEQRDESASDAPTLPQGSTPTPAATTPPTLPAGGLPPGTTPPTMTAIAVGGQAMELVIGATFSHYRIEAGLGQGGMGVVYRAVDLQLDRTVALKVMRPELAADPQFKERFLREAKTAASVLHPNVVTLFAAGEEQGCLYMAFEFVAGGDLDARVKRGGTLPVAEALRIIAECAHGLQAIHEAGLVHRDIKPHNIFLDAKGRALLGDLGLARQTAGDDRLTVTGVGLGTPAYMSPEQALGQADVDIRSDVHALGATLYAILGGEAPFSGNSPFAVTNAVINGDRPSIRERNPAVSAAVEAVIQRAMAKDRDQRYADPQALLEAVLALDEAATGVGGSSSQVPTLPSRTAAPTTGAAPVGDRSARRWPLAVVAVAVLALIAGIAIGLRGGGDAPPPTPVPAATDPVAAATDPVAAAPPPTAAAPSESTEVEATAPPSAAVQAPSDPADAYRAVLRDLGDPDAPLDAATIARAEAALTGLASTAPADPQLAAWRPAVDRARAERERLRDALAAVELDQVLELEARATAEAQLSAYRRLAARDDPAARQAATLLTAAAAKVAIQRSRVASDSGLSEQAVATLARMVGEDDPEVAAARARLAARAEAAAQAAAADAVRRAEARAAAERAATEREAAAERRARAAAAAAATAGAEVRAALAAGDVDRALAAYAHMPAAERGAVTAEVERAGLALARREQQAQRWRRLAEILPDGPAAAEGEAVLAIMAGLGIDAPTAIVRTSAASAGGLAAAVEGLADGGQLLLAPGTYTVDGLELRRPVFITGVGEGVRLRVGGRGLVVRGARAVLSGLEIEGTDDGRRRYALTIRDADPVVAGCRVSGRAGGVRVEGDSAATVVDLAIDGCAGIGLHFEDAAGRWLRGSVRGCGAEGVLVASGSDPQLEGVTIADNAGHGLRTYNAGRGRLEGCVISGNGGHGLLVMDGSRLSMRRGELGGNRQAGGRAVDGSTLTLDAVRIHANAVAGAEAVDGGILNATGCTVEAGLDAGLAARRGGRLEASGCTLSGNAGPGVVIEDGGRVALARCGLVGNGVGLRAEDGARGEAEGLTFGANRGGDLQLDPGARIDGLDR